jgi:hypothetical protein
MIIMNLSLTEIDAQAARERYNDYLRAARHQKLVREAQAAQQPSIKPARANSLIARLRIAVLTRRPVRA